MLETIGTIAAQGLIAIGVLFLGVFVGILLTLYVLRPWLHQRVDTGQGPPNLTQTGLHILVALLGAVLGGTPVVFMGGLTFQKFAYPIGLLFGLSLLRITAARDAISQSQGNTSKAKKADARFAWLDLIAIGGGFLFAMILAFASGAAIFQSRD